MDSRAAIDRIFETDPRRIAGAGLDKVEAEQLTKQQWFKEFGAEFAVPREIWSQFEDESWHNDAGPRFYNPDTQRGLFVQHPNPQFREPDPERPRYSVYQVEGDPEDLDWADVWEGNDLQTAIRHMRGG